MLKKLQRPAGEWFNRPNPRRDWQLCFSCAFVMSILFVFGFSNFPILAFMQLIVIIRSITEFEFVIAETCLIIFYMEIYHLLYRS